MAKPIDLSRLRSAIEKSPVVLAHRGWLEQVEREISAGRAAQAELEGLKERGA